MTVAGLNGKTGDVIRSVIAIGLAALVAYYTAQIQTEHRLTTLETLVQERFDGMNQRFDRIERVMDRIEATGQDRRTGEPYAVQRQFER